ncbi:MAG: 16S rRNA (cytidine(1402)-2'-O)-methyltransferase [Clostridiales bacterium]|nr:16S rRNA (cytidine(1402)-2'-O)-methyltransferase [Clostridiales bacterium]
MLYFVATPIGNLDEITGRALEVLRSVDLIAAEDTRHTAILLSKYGITTKTTAYHKFNERESVDGLIAMLEAGKNIAVVSDAGMPTVSDPGHILIDAAIERGIEYTVVSGACAAIDALVLSGLSTRNFTVLGFLPERAVDRARYVEPFKDVPSTLVFYSAVHDIKKDLKFLFDAFGPRRAAVCREMTKMYETVTRGRLGDELDIVEKGEFVVVIEGASGESKLNSLSIEEHIRHYLEGGMPEKEAVKKVAADRKIAKSEVYSVAVKMKGSDGRS